MKKGWLLKSLAIALFSSCFIISTKTIAATTPLWQEILNNLRKEWRSDEKIRSKIEDLWYNADEYLWKKDTSISKNLTLKVTETWQKIIDSLRDKWLTDNEIWKEIEKLWYDASEYLWKNTTITLKNYSNDLSLKISNKNPQTNERIKLIINIDEKYTWKVYFPKLQYYNDSSEKRTNIDTTSTKYISDYWDALDLGYVKFSSSDKWSISITKFVKFSKSGKYRIYAEDKDWYEDYVQFTLESEDEDEKNDRNNSDETKLELSANTTNLSPYEPIDIILRADNYVGKLLLYAKYRELTSSYRITLNNTSSDYFWDYSDVWEDWYYRMTSSNNGRKSLSDLVEFKKTWAYRIYAENEDWYTNFVQIYVNPDDYDNSESNNYNNSNKNNNSNTSLEDKDIETLIKELLNTWNNSSIQNNIERNKENIKDSNEETYISRSCKQYKIQYNQSLWAFTSPDLKKSEYFVNKEYLKRYIDSKNPQKEGCPQNSWWISTSYKDNSESSDNYIAPNWKVYFISEQNWYFSSNELNSKENFNSISAIKYFIRDRNPLIWMSL